MIRERSLHRLGQLVLTEAVTRFSALIALVGTARWLGPQQYGIFVFGYATGNIAAAVTEGGLSGYLLREGAHGRAGLGSLVRAVGRARLGVTAVSALVVGVLAAMEHRQWVTTATAVVLTASLAFRWVPQSAVTALLGRGDARAGLVQQVIERSVLLVGVFGCMTVAPQPLSAAVGFALSTVAGSATAHFLWRRADEPTDGTASVGLMDVISRTWPFTIASFTVACYLYSGPLIVSVVAGDHAAGIYGAVFGLYSTLIGVPALVMKAAARDMAARGDNVHTLLAARRVAFAGVLLPGLTVAAAPEITQVLLGGAYAEAAPVLMALGAGAAASFGAAFFAYLLMIHHRERDYAAAVAVGFLAYLVAAPRLTSGQGAVGAACALAITEWTGLSLLVVLTRRRGLFNLTAACKDPGARVVLWAVAGVAVAIGSTPLARWARVSTLGTLAMVALVGLTVTAASFRRLATGASAWCAQKG